MELREKVAQLPLAPGVYLYKDAGGRVIYVGKAKSLRHRVRSYFSDDKLADVKTGTLISEARDVDYILVDNEKEALALENNLIKQYKPRFNILLRDDKTYPYIKLTNEKYPRVYVTRRLRKDGATYFGPYFPANLAHRLVHFIHRHFLVPSCKVDLTRYHPKPCLQYHIHRCLGPCVRGADHRRSVRRGGARRAAVSRRPAQRSGAASCARAWRRRRTDMRFEEAAALRDLLTTVEEIEERQKMAAAKGDDVDIFACYAEPPLVARQSVPPAQRPDRGPPRVLLGRPGGVRRAAVLLVAAQADLPGPAVRSRRSSTCRWNSKIARRWKSCSPKSAAARSRSARRSAARRRRMLDLVRDQREAQLRRALPRAEAVVAARSRRRCRTR